jgi:predicted aminopeptidase
MNAAQKWFFTKLAILLTVLFFLFSCSSITGPGYYSHMIYGEMSILANRTPISVLLADKNTPPLLKENLLKIKEMREFAIYEVGLAASGSFTTYADVGRKYATWALTATPEFSVTPRMWCFPIAGCSSYLGFFDETRAERTKKELRQMMYDVSLRGVTAFSTIGWFADPVMNTHFDYTDAGLAGLIIHEKAHEILYVKNDTSFNEAFASFVGQTGQKLWIAKHYGEGGVQKFLKQEKRAGEFGSLIIGVRKELRILYKKNLTPDQMRLAKNETFAKMRDGYSRLKKSWDGYSGYDAWFAKNLNNADVVGTDEYANLVPFFQKLFDLSGQNFTVFYAKAKAIANLPKMERYLEIEKILSE